MIILSNKIEIIMKASKSSIKIPGFEHSGMAVINADNKSFFIFRNVHKKQSAVLLSINFTSTLDEISYHRLFNSHIPNEPYLLWMLLYMKIDPLLLDDLLTRLPTLASTIRERLDFATWLRLSEKQQWKVFSSWWIMGTRPLISQASDIDTFKVLVKHGADIHAVCGFSKKQKKQMIPEFFNQPITQEILNFRRNIIEQSTYRKIVHLGLDTKEEPVLHYRKKSHCIVMHEEKNIEIRLKSDVNRLELIQSNDHVRAIFSEGITMVHSEDLLTDTTTSKYTSPQEAIEVFDTMLACDVYDTTYHPSLPYVELTITFFTRTDRNIIPNEVSLQLPFSNDQGINTIDSLTFMGIQLSKPEDIAMFFTFGYEYLSNQRPQQTLQHAVLRKDNTIVRYLIERGLDPLVHDKSQSLQPPMLTMLADGNTDDIRFYLDKMAHRASDFFAFCLSKQFYQTARKILIKTREPIDYALLCEKYGIDVERLLFTSAADPSRDLIMGSQSSPISPKVYQYEEIDPSHRFDYDPRTFKLILQFCPELVHAYFSSTHVNHDYPEKIRNILEYALDKKDYFLLEFLLTDIVNCSHVLSKEDMRRLLTACCEKRSMRKTVYKKFSAFLDKKYTSPPETAIEKPALADEEELLFLRSQVDIIYNTNDNYWQRWLDLQGTLEQHPEYSSPYKLHESDSIPVMTTLQDLCSARKPFVFFSYPQWRGWINLGLLIKHRACRLQDISHKLSCSTVHDSTLQSCKLTVSRFHKKIADTDEVLSTMVSPILSSLQMFDEEAMVSMANALSLSPSEIENVPNQEKLAKVDPASSVPKKSLVGQNKAAYIRILETFFTQEYLPTYDAMLPMIINRFLVLLHEIQCVADNSKLYVYPSLLPTLRNIYIHKGPFFTIGHHEALMSSLDEIMRTIRDDDKSFGDIKRAVFHFIDHAFTLALNAMNITRPESCEIDNLFKQQLYDHYQTTDIQLRLARLYTVLSMVRTIIDDCDTFENANHTQKLSLKYAAIEVGEHLKADALKIMKICDQSCVSVEQRDCIVMRGHHYHSFMHDNTCYSRIMQDCEASSLSSNIFSNRLKAPHIQACLSLLTSLDAVKDSHIDTNSNSPNLFRTSKEAPSSSSRYKKHR